MQAVACTFPLVCINIISSSPRTIHEQGVIYDNDQMSAEPFYFVKLSVHRVAVHKLILWHLLEFGISLLYRVPGVVPMPHHDRRAHHG